MARYVSCDALGEVRPPGRADFEINGFPQGAHVTDQIRNRHSRKVGQLGLAAAAAVAVVAGLASPAYANFPHFRDASVSLAGSSLATADTSASSVSLSAELPDLLFTWTEVGLGSANVVYRLETVVTATFGCVNGGTNRPKASNKTTVTAPLQTTVELAADRNGRITGSVLLDTGSVSPTDFSCPTGQTQAALSATFTNNTITDTTNGVTATDDDISVTF
ncbi:MAG: hypothetical protein ACRDWG_19410 [Actinomycetes bacterium]